MQIALFRKGDQLLQLRLDGLGLGLGRLDPLVVDRLLDQVREQRLTVCWVAGELVAFLVVAHN